MSRPFSKRNPPKLSRFLVAVVLVLPPTLHAQTTITVNTTEDLVSTNSNCSLREAIATLNTGIAVDACATPAGAPFRLEFSLGSGVQTITAASSLPPITETVTIDATPAGTCASADWQVVLAGPYPGTGALALDFDPGSDGSVVRGLVIQGFSVGVDLGSDDNLVVCNRLGTDATGTVAVPNRDGVLVRFTDRNVIGTNGDATDDADEGNLISGNERYGIFLRAPFNGPATFDNVVAGNIIGLDASGSDALGNGEHGIEMRNLSARIGTDGDGTSDAFERNVISGNGLLGIKMDGNFLDSTTVIAGNIIGADAAGLVARSNGPFDPSQRIGGILVESGVNAVRIGTNADGVSDELERNLISGNALFGVILAGDRAHFAGNWVGVDSTGLAALPNRVGVGVIAGDADDNVIGTDGDGSGDALEGNVISGNVVDGVLIEGRGSEANGNRVSGNLIGFGIDGVTPLGQHAGVHLDGLGRDNLIGADGNAAGDALEVNRIGNNFDAIQVFTNDGYANRARCNLIGVDANGISAPNEFGLHQFSSELAFSDNFVYYSSSRGVQIDAGLLAGSDGNAVVCNATGANFTGGGQLTFEDNWWGSADGPSGVGPGSGDTVGAGLDFDPFLAAATSACGLTALSRTACFPADLALVKTDGPDPVLAGGTLTYTLTVTNNGPDDAVGVAVTDTLPPGVTFDTSLDGCTEALGVVTCPLGTLPLGTMASASFTVVVGNNVAGDLVNVATVIYGNELDAGDNAATATTTVTALPTIPVTSPVGLLLLGLALALASLLALRRP